MVNRASFEVVLKNLLPVFLCLCSFLSLGQYGSMDQNPFSLKFYRISLSSAPIDLLFPAGYDSVAQETANQIESKWLSIGSGFPKNKHRFQVILQNQGLNSNGFVSLISPRAELFTTATQDAALLGTNDWLSLLVSHEMRHIHQNNASRHGFAKLIYGLFGAYGQAVYSNLLIPNWLWEGDAVETESKINSMGRSNIPQFKLPLKAYLETYGVPSYAKMMGKSYRQLVPNHYVFGQYFSEQLTKEFGDEFIPSVWQSTLNHPSLFAFSRQIKKRSGMSIDKYAFNLFSNFMTDKPKSPILKQGYTQYLYPNVLHDGRIIALKSGFSDIKQLVEIQQGHERRLTYLGPHVDASMLSASDDFVVWSELDFDPRWGQKQHSRILFYDFKARKTSFWENNQKWISPSISGDSKLVSFIHVKENGQNILQVYDRENRKSLASLVAQAGEQFLQPRLCDSSTLVYVSKIGGNKSLCIWNYLCQSVIYRKDFGQHNIAHPSVSGDWIYFNYPHKDVDQIARLHIKDNRFELVTDERWGAYQASANADSIVYSAYKATGNEVVKLPLIANSIDFKIINKPTDKDSSKTRYASEYVSKWNLLNPFTWGPVISSNGNQLDLSIISRDVLNSLQATAGIRYAMNENSLNQFTRLSYQAWYPIIDVNYQSSNRQTQLYIDNKKPLDSLRTDNWKQQTWDLGFRIPLNLTHNAYQEFLQFGSNLGFLQVSGYDLTKRYYTEPFNGNYSFVKHQVYYSYLLNRSLWDVQARKGIVLQANWQGMPFKQSLQDELWNIQGQMYLPGMFKHDGVLLRVAYQQESIGNYRFASSINFPRGYLYTSFNRLTTMGIDYRFPIKNTDINLGRILYVTRIKGNLFGDWGYGEDFLSKTTQSFHSFGVDLSAQFHAFRFSQAFELGVRALYISESKSWAIVPLVIDIGF